MGVLQQYRYTAQLQYLNIKKGTYVRVYPENIKWIMVDRDYEKYNMPLIYLNMSVDKNLADDMILNYKENLINLDITKHAYDPDDDSWMDNIIEERYIYGQFEYFLDESINANKEIDYGAEENEDREDIYRNITIGLMKLSLINDNRKHIEMTLNKTTMTNAIITVTKDLNELVMEPLQYNDVLDQIMIPSTDSISKAIDALNNIKVLYSTPYRFFMDFDNSYLLSSDGVSVQKKGQRISDLLISIKKSTDVEGMVEGVYVNRKQKNYQINVSSVNISTYDNQSSEKTVTELIGINTSGSKQEETLDIDNKASNTSKISTVKIPNDNLNMIKNIKAKAETDAYYVCMVKDNVDSSIIDINGLTVIHHLDENVKYNGQYLLAHKREIIISDGFDFTMTVVANYKKLRKVV